MNTDYIYRLVLIIIMVTWFVPISPPSRLQTEQSKKKEALVAPVHIITDLSLLGVNNREGVAGGSCNIEFINDDVVDEDVYTISKNKQLKLVGWAMDNEKKRLPENTVIRFKNDTEIEFYALALSGLIREDVRNYFDLTNSVKGSGFELIINTSELPEGIYALTVVLLFTDKILICDNGRKINVQ